MANPGGPHADLRGWTGDLTERKARETSGVRRWRRRLQGGYQLASTHTPLTDQAPTPVGADGPQRTSADRRKIVQCGLPLPPALSRGESNGCETWTSRAGNRKDQLMCVRSSARLRMRCIRRRSRSRVARMTAG